MFKYLLLALCVTFVLTSDLCPAKLLQKCEDDLKDGIQACEKAAQEKGADQTADINCVKYLLSARKDCWPCICDVAKKQHIKVKGCDFVMELMNVFKEFNLRTAK